jgi:integrase/recombinase XerD
MSNNFQIIKGFLEFLQVRHYSPATISSRRESLKLFFRYLEKVGLTDLREVTRRTICDYQAWLMERFATNSVHVHLIALRRFFEHLEVIDAIFLNPCAGLCLPKLEDRLPRGILTPTETRALLDAPDTRTPLGVRDKAILELFYSTAVRLGEMTRLTVEDVDHENGFCRVNRGKGAKDRVVPMGRMACDWVRNYLEQVRPAWSKDREERALWLARRVPHQPLKKQMIAVLVRRYAIRAGLTQTLSPHLLRHCCAAHLVSNGSSIASVQRLLGHRSLQTTQRYTRVSIPEVKRSFQQAHPRAQVEP